MKARPIIKRQFTFPVLAVWEDTKDINPVVVLFLDNVKGIGVLDSQKVESICIKVGSN